MQTRHIILCAISVAAVALGVLFFFTLKKHNAQMEKIRQIPEMSLVTIDGDEFRLSETRAGRKTAIMFFSPDCEFCRQELKGVIDNRTSFRNVDWVFVTLSAQEDIEGFLLEYPLLAIPNARICIEEWPDLFLVLDVTAPPSIFIYNEKGRLEHYKRGAVSIKTILEWLK